MTVGSVSADWLRARAHLHNSQIAAELGCSGSYVYWLFKRAGVVYAAHGNHAPLSAPAFRRCPCIFRQTECIDCEAHGDPLPCETLCDDMDRELYRLAERNGA